MLCRAYSPFYVISIQNYGNIRNCNSSDHSMQCKWILYKHSALILHKMAELLLEIYIFESNWKY